MRNVLLIIVFFAAALPAQEAEYLFEQGNNFYKEGEYSQAIESYEAVLQQGYESAPLYYNLGNAYYKTRQIGKAVLNYERAKKIADGDPDVEHNLQIAELRVVDKIETPAPGFLFSTWNSIKHAFSVNQWAALTLGLWFLLAMLLLMRWLVRVDGLQRFAAKAVLPIFVVFLVAASVFGIRANKSLTTEEAVVIVDKVDVKSSPAADATDLFSLHEGLKVEITERSGEFVRIELKDGKVGWMPSSAIEII